jgi:hypothetical protein
MDKRDTKKVIIYIVMVVINIIWWKYVTREPEIQFTYLGETAKVREFGGYYFWQAPYYRTQISNVFTDAVLVENDEELKQICAEIDLDFPYEVDFTQTYVLVTYGRRIEQLHWSSAGTANFFHYGFAFGWKYLLFTFSETYYPDTAFFYLIDAESYIGYSNFSDSGDCYILVNNTERVYIGQWGDLSSRETVQNAIEKAEQSS